MQRWILHSIVLLHIGLTGCAKPLSKPPVESSEALLKTGARCQAHLKVDQVCLDSVWETYPTETDFGTLIVVARDDKSGFLKTSFTPDLKVKLWMPSMGHGSSPVRIDQIQPGILKIERVFFNMRGDWEIRFQTKTDQAAWSLEF